MLTSIEGVYRNGHIELAEQPTAVDESTRVLVTFLDQGEIDLRARGIDAREATRIRAHLASFAEEWDSPEMDVYDDYDSAKSRLLTWRCCFSTFSSFQLADGETASGRDRPSKQYTNRNTTAHCGNDHWSYLSRQPSKPHIDRAQHTGRPTIGTTQRFCGDD